MVSVIIPAYNRENYIKPCLESISGQSYDDIEIIVVDDGSTDSTLKICRDMSAGDKRIKVVTRSNGGLSRARNTGLDNATGDFVTFVDSDDMLHRKAVETLVKIAGESRCDIVAAEYLYSDSPDFKTSLSTEFRLLDSTTAIERTLYQTHSMNNSACGKLFRRSLFDSMRFTEGLTFEDLDIFYKLYHSVEKVAVTKARVYFYRAHPSSYINTWSPARLDAIKVCKDLRDYIAANIPSLNKAADDRMLSAAFNIMINVTRHGDNGSVADECWKTIKKLRFQSLTNPKVRLKNKIGIASSYAGRKLIIHLSKWLSKY